MRGEGIPEVVIRSLDELVEAVTPERPDPDSGRLRDHSIYRGLADARWSLLTSLDRLGAPETAAHSKGDLEEHLLRNFIRYARPFVRHAISEWEHLVMAQHHGLNTRLLDWTYSPLVAAHFATARCDDGGAGVIWRLDWQRVHACFGLPQLALMVDDLSRVLGPLGYSSPWDLFRGDGPAPRRPMVCMVEPPTLDIRIAAQAATFTLCSDKSRPLDEILVSCGLGGALTRFIVPPPAMQKLRDQLDICGVSERRLFPDLDGLAQDTRRYYGATAPRPPWGR